jgi:TonB family protein
LELYSGLQARNPADADARAGLTEVHERLLTRAENALLEERLNEAAAAIETARNAGVESGRIAFLSLQLAKAREQIKAAQERVLQQSRVHAAPKAEEDHVTPLPTLADQRNPNEHPLEPARDADIDASAQLSKNAELQNSANERLLQDRLTEPANDNAIGFGSAEVSSAQQDLDAAVAKNNFMTNLVPANQLTVLKTVQPVYPIKAQNSKNEGWVDVEFTVSETGKVQDVVVRAASMPGVFEDAAVKAVNQWRYRPILRDTKPVPVRTQLRLRFTLS